MSGRRSDRWKSSWEHLRHRFRESERHARRYRDEHRLRFGLERANREFPSLGCAPPTRKDDGAPSENRSRYDCDMLPC